MNREKHDCLKVIGPSVACIGILIKHIIGSGYNTLLLRLTQCAFYSACPHRQFDTLPGLLRSQAALQTTISMASSLTGRRANQRSVKHEVILFNVWAKGVCTNV